MPYKWFFFLIIHDLDFEPWEEFYYRCFFPFLQKLQKILRFSNILLTPFHILLVSLRIEMTLLICRHYIPSSQYSYLVVSYVATFFPKWWCERCVFLLCNCLSLRNWLKSRTIFACPDIRISNIFHCTASKSSIKSWFFWYQFLRQNQTLDFW